MYEYILLSGHNCEYLYSEERTTGGFLRMATNKPPCVIMVSGVASLQILLHNNSALHIITTPNKIQSQEVLLNEMFTSNNIYTYSISYTNTIPCILQ